MSVSSTVKSQEEEEKKKGFHRDSIDAGRTTSLFLDLYCCTEISECTSNQISGCSVEARTKGAECGSFYDHGVAQKLNDQSPGAKLGDETSRSVTE